MDSQRLERSEDIDPSINEDLADRIEKEWSFKLKRAPYNIIIRFQIVPLILVLLECLLIISNNFHYFGYWKLFVHKSSHVRDSIFPNLPLLDPYSLWRGWLVPSFLASFTYIVVALLSLRNELYHWKPELLEHYLESARASKIGKYVPEAWLDFAFHIYQDNHRTYISNRIQKQTHNALNDATEFMKIIRTVAFNILISIFVLLVFWTLLLQTDVDEEHIVQLPKSYVPPIQGLVWYFFNDMFYFYPHWIAHHRPSTGTFYYKILPSSIAKGLYAHFNNSHKLHHKTKANLGIAAWYCSPWEQVLFNIIPVLIGPLFTQVLADSFGLSSTWGTHLITLYVWLMSGAAMSVLAHTGYRSVLNDPGKHDLHHERAFNPKTAVNFGTLGFFDWLHGTKSAIPKAEAKAWQAQTGRLAALKEASRRSGVKLTTEQLESVQQPVHDREWVDKDI